MTTSASQQSQDHRCAMSSGMAEDQACSVASIQFLGSPVRAARPATSTSCRVYRNEPTARCNASIVSFRYARSMPQASITLSFDEALYIADLLAVAADATSNGEDVPDTFPAEARLAINLILSRTDD